MSTETTHISPLPEDPQERSRPLTTLSTLEDVISNNYRQNKSINYLVANVQVLKTQFKLIEELVEIHKTVRKVVHVAGWILAFLGLSGVYTVINWFSHTINHQ